MKKFIEKKYILIIAIILAFMAVVSILNADRDALIYDESAHIPAGYSYLTQHDMRLNPEHPPLLKDLAAFPLLFMRPNFDTTQDFWTKDNADASQWNAGKSFLFNSGNDPDRIIFWSRLPIILLSLILGLFIFRWAKELAGISAGLFALALYAFDPNVLGHNHFVTTDLGIAAFLTFAFYYFLRFIKEPTWKNVAIAGLFLGLVQLVKFSSVLAFPVFGLLLILYPLVRLSRHKGFTGKIKNLYDYLLKGAIVFAISLVIVWVAYYINTYNMPQTKLPEIMDHYFNPHDTRPITIYARKALLEINDQPILMPLADYLFGVARVFQRVAGGNITYFMGEISNKGFLSYFPIIFIIKEPLLLLFLIFFTLGIGILRITKSVVAGKIFKNIAHYLRTNIVSFAMIAFIAIYAFTSITGRLNIGFRHLFPILPFMYILLAKNIFIFIKNRHRNSHSFYLGVVILTAFLAIETVLAYPYYTSYFNQLAGGPKNGYHLATDSNADWGQDLKRLNIWLGQYDRCTQTKSDTEYPSYCYKISNLAPEAGRPIEKIKIDYFGMADLDYYLGDKYEKWWAAKRPIEPGFYAISALFLQESIYDRQKLDDKSYRWLKNKQPFAQVGTSILIYNISEEEAKKINYLNL